MPLSQPPVGGDGSPRTTGGKKDAAYVIDPCGRTPNKLCDHKGRMVDVLRLPAGRSGLSHLRHGGYLSGTLSGALMPILADVQSNLIPIVETFYRVIPNRGWKNHLQLAIILVSLPNVY